MRLFRFSFFSSNESVRRLVAFSRSANPSAADSKSTGDNGAEGYGDRGYEVSALLNSVGSRAGLFGNSAKRIPPSLFRTFGRGERGSSNSAIVGDSYRRAVSRVCFGGSASLKPPRVGEYTRSPHAGNASGFGDTDIGARS